MITEARKLSVIEKILKVQNENVMAAVENVLKSPKPKPAKASIYDFVGIISKSDAAKMKAAIAETCETIDENEWK